VLKFLALAPTTITSCVIARATILVVQSPDFRH